MTHQGGTIDHDSDTQTCEACDAMEADCVNLESSSHSAIEYLKDYKVAFNAHPGSCQVPRCSHPTNPAVVTGINRMVDHVIGVLERGQRKK